MYQELRLEPGDSDSYKARIILSPMTIHQLRFRLEWIASFTDMIELEIQASPGLRSELVSRVQAPGIKNARVLAFLNEVIEST